MRSCNALRRLLLSLGTAVLCIALFGAPANGDDGAPIPRAVPAARALPRSFGTYDELIAYASALAADQGALDQRLTETRRQYDAAIAALRAITPAKGHGGSLFDADDYRGVRSLEATLSVQAVTLYRTQQQLVGAGALTGADAGWRMPTEGELTQPFGPSSVGVEPARVYHGVAYAHFHEGVDIAGAWMADVVAPARGRVVFVGRMMDGAEVVVLAHDAGVVTMYVHLDAQQSPPPVAAGDEVAAGQKIGTQGLTGITTGQHLHWAAYRNGGLIDPLSLLPN